jgi:penicillin amidase
MRMVVDLSDLDSSVTVHTTGQSGHAYNTHYDDMAPLWSIVSYYQMLYDPKRVRKAAEAQLILAP